MLIASREGGVFFWPEMARLGDPSQLAQAPVHEKSYPIEVGVEGNGLLQGVSRFVNGEVQLVFSQSLSSPPMQVCAMERGQGFRPSAKQS